MNKEVIISNSSVNAHGFRILTSGIDYSQYERNPIVLWNHHRPEMGTVDEVLPIGRMENLRIDGDNLIGSIVFDETDDFAKKIKSKFDSGFLKMVSAGLEIFETSSDVALALPGQRRATVTKSRLVEVSVVDIGSNSDAMVLYRDNATVNLSDFAPLPEIVFKSNLNDDSEMKTFALKLGLPETATEAEILARIGELQAAALTASGLQNEVKLQREKAIETEVDSAIALKRITANRRDHFIALGKASGIELLHSTLEAISPALKPTEVINRSGAGADPDYKKLSDVPAGERIELRKNDAEKYAALYEAEYGFKPVLE